MLQANLFLVFLEHLNKSNLPYMVTGSAASIIYGEPRMTHDIDIVLQLHAEDVQNFISLFSPEQFYCPAQEVIKTEIAKETKGHFNLIHHETGFKADIYPTGKDELHEWAMTNRRKVEIGQSSIWIAPPEYVIVRKLQYYKEGGSEKHLRDINKMSRISGES
ncbi:MAG: hypothetical protein ACYSSI_14155, partial [Planctomycetota bacterium]